VQWLIKCKQALNVALIPYNRNTCILVVPRFNNPEDLKFILNLKNKVSHVYQTSMHHCIRVTANWITVSLTQYSTFVVSA